MTLAGVNEVMIIDSVVIDTTYPMIGVGQAYFDQFKEQVTKNLTYLNGEVADCTDYWCRINPGPTQTAGTDICPYSQLDNLRMVLTDEDG